MFGLAGQASGPCSRDGGRDGPPRRQGVIEGYKIVIPILLLLDKNPATLTPSELQQIGSAQADRLVQVIIELDYAGAIHRLAIKLKFV